MDAVLRMRTFSEWIVNEWSSEDQKSASALPGRKEDSSIRLARFGVGPPPAT
jgi:hypothetical protein